jgi:hypothetical protein
MVLGGRRRHYGGGGEANEVAAACRGVAGARGCCGLARRNSAEWSRDHGGVWVRRERGVGGIYRRGLAWRGG